MSDPHMDDNRYAVTDIGSNAVRLIIGVINNDDFLTEAFIRLPIQLGSAAFSNNGVLPADNVRRLQQTLMGMRYFVDAMQPVKIWHVVATAALRGAANRDEILTTIRQQCEVNINLLTGEEEAAVIGRFVAKQFAPTDSVLNVDVGGGSTDCALMKNGDIVCADTFAVGTARVDAGSAAEKKRLAEWIKACDHTIICGSGGSVRALAGLCGKISAEQLALWREKLVKLTAADIAKQYDLSPDRAGHIVAAIDIYQLAVTVSGGELCPVSGGLAEAVLRDIAAQ